MPKHIANDYDVFVSYTREDDKARAALVAELETAGYKVFWDSKLDHDLWKNDLREAINRSTIVICLWSAKAAASENVMAEAFHAFGVKKLLSVLIESKSAVPKYLTDTNLHPFEGWADENRRSDQIARILATVERVTGGPGSPSARTVQGEKSAGSPTGDIFRIALAAAVALVAWKLTVNASLPAWLAQVAAGIVLAGCIWFYFERLESVISNQTKFYIAAWLRGVEVGKQMLSWPETFLHIFNKVFSSDPFSLSCILRSALASCCLAALVIIAGLTLGVQNPRATGGMFWDVFPTMLAVAVFTNVIPDYVSLLITRGILALMKRVRSGFLWIVLLVIDLCLTGLIGGVVFLFMMTLLINVWASAYDPWVPLEYTPILRLNMPLREPFEVLSATLLDYAPYIWFFPFFFSSAWLWLYAGTGYLVKVASGFNILLRWVNRNFDIENSPLQTIGFIAGTIVAVVYWSIAFVVPFIHPDASSVP